MRDARSTPPLLVHRNDGQCRRNLCRTDFTPLLANRLLALRRWPHMSQARLPLTTTDAGVNQMPTLRRTLPRLTPGEALYVLERLFRDRRLTVGEITRLVTEMHGEIKELEDRLAALRQATGSVRSSSESRPTHGSRTSKRPVARRVTPELAKSRRLQGEYMGLIRHIQGPGRARMKKLASDHGREAAIKAMRAALAE